MANNKTEKKTTKSTKNKVEPKSSPNFFSKTIQFFKDMRGGTTTNNPDEMPKAEIVRFCIGAILFIVSSFILLSITSHLFTAKEDDSWIEGTPAHNWMGTLGLSTARYFIDNTWGVSSFFIPLFMLVASLRIMQIYKVRLWKWFINCSILMIWSSVILRFAIQPSMPADFKIDLGGEIGKAEVNFLIEKTGTIGTILIIISVTLLYLIYLSDETIRIIRKIFMPETYKRSKKNEIDGLEDNLEQDDLQNYNNSNNEFDGCDVPYEGLTPEETATTIEFNDITADLDSQTKKSDDESISLEFEVNNEDFIESSESDKTKENTIVADEMTIIKGKEEEEAQLDETRQLEPYDPKLDLENYKYPTIDLLKHYDIDTSIDMEEQQQNKNRIIQVLMDFGVKISSIKATVGPTITLYEITPAPGVRISKIRNLEDDIALSLSALGIRIIAPIPGKGTIGIEVPNARPQIVSMESIINSRKFQETQYELPMALGKTITNELYMVDLAKMPHLLVAGSTGSGKSVCINSFIASILIRMRPDECKLVLVDPKKVELSMYNGVPHLLAPVVTDPKKANIALKKIVVEMERRYDVFSESGTKNIAGYNKYVEKKNELLPESEKLRKLPYIVVIIDELADLMLVAAKEVEDSIMRITQMARAAGIHLIVATQRPSTDVITGVVKANIPSRISFAVSSSIDSRTILDMTGAEKLLGKGDMLFLPQGENTPIRVQGTYISEEEISSVVDHVIKQQKARYDEKLLMDEEEMHATTNVESSDDADEPLYNEIVEFVVTQGKASASLLQRRFRLGYNRAARVIDLLEERGIIGPNNGSKPREVLVKLDSRDE